MAAKSVHGVERVRSKLEACINSGNYYEAHQMYRTLYFRCSCTKCGMNILKRIQQKVCLVLLVTAAKGKLNILQQHCCCSHLLSLLLHFIKQLPQVDALKQHPEILNSNRYLSQEKYTALLDLLCDGAIILLKHDQQSSGADLAILYVEVLVKSTTKPGEAYFTTLANLFQMINSEIPERETFLANALRWSISGSEVFKSGHPQLHQLIAEIFWKEKNYVLARYHYLHSTDGQGCATMLVELHVLKGYQSEVDLFIAQAVLQYLCLHNKKAAAVAFKSYTTQHPNIKTGPPYLLPLLNFIWFLLKAVESGKLTVFTVLCERYQPIIKRDPTYSEYLDKIAQIFFGVPPPRPRKQGVLGNLFQSFGNLFNDFNDSDSDEGTPSTSTTSTHKMETEDLD